MFSTFIFYPISTPWSNPYLINAIAYQLSTIYIPTITITITIYIPTITITITIYIPTITTYYIASTNLFTANNIRSTTPTITTTISTTKYPTPSNTYTNSNHQ